MCELQQEGRYLILKEHSVHSLRMLLSLSGWLAIAAEALDSGRDFKGVVRVLLLLMLRA